MPIKPDRRSVLKWGVLGGAAAYALPGLAWNLSLQHPSASEQVNSRSSPLETESKINTKEYGRERLRRIQEAIKKNGFDALVVSSFHMDYTGYVSNYHPIGVLMWPAVVFIPAEGPPTIWLRTYPGPHERAIRETLWIEDAHNLPGTPTSENDYSKCYEACLDKIKSLKLTNGRIGLVGDEIDWLLTYYFRDKLPSLRVEDANHVLNAVRIVKDKEELALLRRAQWILDEVAYPRLKELLVPGARDYDIYAEVVASMIKSGADALSLLILGIGAPSAGTWAAPPHGSRVNKGDIILTEPIPYVGHYNTEKMFTFAVGKDVPEEQQRAATVIYDSFLIALERMKPGVELRPVLEECLGFIKSKGYEGSTVLIGHWIGLDNHEGARITPEGTEGLILQPGMVLSWHPNVVVPGKVRTCCSSCLLITDEGVESMSRIPLQPMYFL